jgi:hypothetical protein
VGWAEISVAQATSHRRFPACTRLRQPSATFTATFMWWQQMAILFSDFHVVADGGSKLYL